MRKIPHKIASLRRPRLLVTAARIASGHDPKGKNGRKLLGETRECGPEKALDQLCDMEAELDHLRRSSDARYSISRHISVLSAIMGEVHRLQGATAPVNAAQLKVVR